MRIKGRWFAIGTVIAAVTVALLPPLPHVLPAAETATAANGITVGTTKSPEPLILGELYAQVLAAKRFKVTFRSDLESSALVPYVKSGEIAMFPGFTGSIVNSYSNFPTVPRTAHRAWLAARKVIARQRLTLLEPSRFSDSLAIAVLTSTAKRLGLKTIADLKKLGVHLTLGGSDTFRTSYHGLLGLQKEYGLRPRFFSTADSFAALDSRHVVAAATECIDPHLLQSKYTVLTDSRRLFTFQNAAPVVSPVLLNKLGPRFAEVVNDVSRRLTTRAIREMIASVTVRHNSVSSVTRQFLSKNGCLSVVDGCKPPPPPTTTPQPGTCGS